MAVKLKVGDPFTFNSPQSPCRRNQFQKSRNPHYIGKLQKSGPKPRAPSMYGELARSSTMTLKRGQIVWDYVNSTCVSSRLQTESLSHNSRPNTSSRERRVFIYFKPFFNPQFYHSFSGLSLASPNLSCYHYICSSVGLSSIIY